MVATGGTKAGARKARRKRSGKASYLFVGKGGTLYVASARTGDVRQVDPKNAAKIHELLKERQRLGVRIATELRKQGYPLDDEVVVNIET